MADEAESLTVLRHRADDVIRHATGHPRLDLESDLDIGTDERGQVLEHLLGDAAGVTGGALRSESYGAVEALRLGLRDDTATAPIPSAATISSTPAASIPTPLASAPATPVSARGFRELPLRRLR
ncbi:MAG: hypothetical protein M3418_04490, partial [Gemmatimonadota bacterium]|nr:hypothetical protein [Gemmatimonadota bacterium]